MHVLNLSLWLVVSFIELYSGSIVALVYCEFIVKCVSEKDPYNNAHTSGL